MSLVKAADSALPREDREMQKSEKLTSSLAVALLLGTASAGWAQRGSGPMSGQGTGQLSQGTGQSTGKGSLGNTVPPSLPPIAPDLEPPSQDMQANQERMRNRDRQKQLVMDTQKLLTLANELKVDVDKSTKDTMSLDVIRKADEIEKLAHTVKEKMKGE
jgi:hypothetical protein